MTTGTVPMALQPAISSNSSASNHTTSSAALHASSSQLSARRYAIKYQPPCFFLEYEDASGKRRVRVVKLVSVTSETDVDRLARKVIRSFPRQIDAKSVKHEQVHKLIGKLVENIRQLTASDTLQYRIAEAAASPTAAGPLQLPTPTDSPHIASRNRQLQLSRSPDEYLHESSDSRFSTSTTSLRSSLGANGHARLVSKDITTVQKPGNTTATSRALDCDNQVDQTLVLDMDLPEDLNRVSEHDLAMAKRQMDHLFNSNQVRPGDQDYKYDKQVDFAPATEDNDWDEESD